MHQSVDPADVVAVWSEQDPHGSMPRTTMRDVETLRHEVQDLHNHFEILCKEVFRGLDALESIVEHKLNSGTEAATAPTPHRNGADSAPAGPEQNDGFLKRLAALEHDVPQSTDGILARLAALESDVPQKTDGILARLAALESGLSELRSARNDSPESNSAGGVGPMDQALAEILQQSSSQRHAPRDDARQVEQQLVDVQRMDGNGADVEQAAGEVDPKHSDPSPKSTQTTEQLYIPDSYVFQESVWDASILLLCRNGDGMPLMFKWDEVMVVAAFVMNVAVQSLFLAIVQLDMLPKRDFSDPNTVSDMLVWRAERAHVLGQDGLSYLEQICDRSVPDWSYLKDAVGAWQTYIAEGDEGEVLISGLWLSLMALILWTVTCLTEYRAVVEQARGIWLLPAPKGVSPWKFGFGRCNYAIEDGAVSGEIISMPYPTKALIFGVMSIPRLGLLVALSVMGIRFVAETASLVDLVLNAIALAFVLDIDNFLAGSFLTKHVRDSCTEMKPLTCGRTLHGCWAGCTKRDMVKLFVWLAMLAYGIFALLFPYYNIAEASVQALCAGNVHFIVKGANDTVPTTIIVDMADAERALDGSVGSKFYQTCEPDLMNRYLDTYYPSLEHGVAEESGVGLSPQEVTARAQALTLDYAFLEPGEPLKNILQEQFDALSFTAGATEYKVRNDDWSAADMQECPRFETHYRQGWAACTPMPLLDENTPNCTWSRGADLCDGEPPGTIYRQACALSSQTEKMLSCQVWASFHVQNPYLNCQKVVNETEVELGASLSLEVADAEYFVMQVQQNTTIYDAVVQTLADGLAQLPAGVAAPGASPMDFRPGSLIVDTGAMRRLQVVGGEEDSAAEGRALGVGDENTTTNTPSAAPGSQAGQIDIPFSIVQAPDTLTEDYFSQVNWTQVAGHMSYALTALDSRLRVEGFVSESSAVKVSYCDSYVWCHETNKVLKANAAAIPGPSDEACCDLTCWSWWTPPTKDVIESFCATLTTPSEILRSEDALKTTLLINPSNQTALQVCCEEQLRCDVFDVGHCTEFYVSKNLVPTPSDVLLNDAHNVYQGVQSAGYSEISRVCCSVSCQDAQAIFDFGGYLLCDASGGKALVTNASTAQPDQLDWEDRLQEYIKTDDPGCCVPTTVLCTTWYSMTYWKNKVCVESNEYYDYFRVGLVLPTANETYGEHFDLCCQEPCTIYEDDYPCPAGQRMDDDVPWLGPDYDNCCRPSTCGEYYYDAKEADDYTCYTFGQYIPNYWLHVSGKGYWFDECCDYFPDPNVDTDDDPNADTNVDTDDDPNADTDHDDYY